MPSWGIGSIRIQAQAPPGVRPKLAVSQPGDPSEREADQVSEVVSRVPRACTCGGTCAACRAESSSDSPAEPRQAEVPSAVWAVLRSSGEPLDGATRRTFEGKFGHSFRDVRVHTGAAAAESARAMQARAYTVGNHLVFGAAQYAPATPAGGKLLAHELTHVLQPSSRVVRRNAVPGQFKDPRLSDAALIARANEIYEKAATELLKDRGKTPSPEVLSAMRRQVTVGVLQGYKNGKLVTLVNAHNAKWEPYVRRALQGGETYVEGVAVAPYKVRTDEVRKSGHIAVHSEQVLAAEAKAEGLTESRVATSNNACTEQCMSNLTENYPEVTHVNPNRNYLRNAPPPPPAPPAPRAKEPAKPPPIPDAARKAAPKAEGTRTGSEVGRTTGVENVQGEAARGARGQDIETRAYTGDPVEVNEPAVNNPHAMIEGLLVMLQAKEFENLQRAEVQKYEDKLRKLTPQIEALRNEGKNVGVTLIVERPDKFNLTHDVLPESSDLIYFVDLRIDPNPWWAGVDPNYNAQAREEARGGTLDQQLRAQLGDQNPTLGPPRKGWHYERATKVLPSYRSAASQRGFDGTYRPTQVVRMINGDLEAAKAFGLHRVVHIWHGAYGQLNLEMRDAAVKAARPAPSTSTSAFNNPPASMSAAPDQPAPGRSDPDAYVDVSPLRLDLQQNQSRLGGVFVKGVPGQPGSYRIEDAMTNSKVDGKDVLLEVVTGEDLDPRWRLGTGSKWSAIMLWEKL
jgi:hypothetical protein